MERIELLENKIAFLFLEEVSNQGFTGKSESGIIVSESDSNQVKVPRWGKVIKCSPEVTEVTEGDYILVEPLGWTNKIELTEADVEQFWVTTEDRIMAVTENREIPKIL